MTSYVTALNFFFSFQMPLRLAVIRVSNDR